jgi:DNA polymerase-4
MGHEHTLARDEADGEMLDALLLRLTEQVARRLRRAGMQGRTVTVKIRFTDFRTITRQRTLSRSTDEERAIYPVAREILHRNRGRLPLRLLGVSLSGLMKGEWTDSLFSADRRHRDVLGAVDHLRDRFGENVMTRARILAVLHGNHHERPSYSRSLRSRPAGT